MYIKNLSSLINNINNVFKKSNIIKPSVNLLKYDLYNELNKYSGDDWIKHTKINNNKKSNTNFSKINKNNFRKINTNKFNINKLNMLNINDFKLNKINNYDKELIYSNNIINMYLITWFPFSSSSIHGHGDNGCLFKVLNGPIKETIYDKKYNIKKINIHNTSDLNYIKPEYLHKMLNNNYKCAVSLHIY